MRRGLQGLSHLLFHGVALLSAAYALIAYIPFTYQEVLRAGLLPWLNTFGRLQPLLFWVALALLGLLEYRTPRFRPFLGLHGAAGLCLAIHPLLPGLGNQGSSLATSLLFMASALWLALLDLLRGWPGMAEGLPEEEDLGRLWGAALGAGALTWIFFFLRAPRVGAWPALAWSLGAQLLVFLLLGVLLTLFRATGRQSSRPVACELALVLLLATGLGAGLTYRLIYAAIAFQGPLAALHAGGLALLILGIWVALACGFQSAPIRDPLDFLLRPLQGFGPRPGTTSVWVLLVLALFLVLLRKAVAFDWNFLFQKLLALTFWVVAYAVLYGLAGRWRSRKRPLFASTLVLVALLQGSAWGSWGPRLQAALEQRVSADPSARLLRDALKPQAPSQGSIYKILQGNSNISQAIRTDPVEVCPVEDLVPTTGYRPHIFVVVVDSLRPDYLGAYNPKAGFTPSIDAFARESVILPKSFTRYGATGLAEPSIWVGGLMLHKQYVTPFHPMNALQKLLRTDGYQAFVSQDSILDVVVKPEAFVHPMDVGVGTQSLRLGRSLQELQRCIQERMGGGGPLFAYTQAQDIHVSVIHKEGESNLDGGPYSGFYAPYASRVRRLDGDFGGFIRFLKEKGLYEDSVVILTSDHGDSLGEEGRFGHAYTLFPEIVRIPLLVHLPKRLQGLWHDPEQVAFNSDITPTLYYLLGHRPLRPSPIFGRPLFLGSEAEAAPYHQSSYLLASSYGAVFGILDGRGRSLYISDGVNFADHLFSLGDTPTRRDLGTSEKARYDREILEKIRAVNTFYRFTPPGGQP